MKTIVLSIHATSPHSDHPNELPTFLIAQFDESMIQRIKYMKIQVQEKGFQSICVNFPNAIWGFAQDYEAIQAKAAFAGSSSEFNLSIDEAFESNGKPHLNPRFSTLTVSESGFAFSQTSDSPDMDYDVLLETSLIPFKELDTNELLAQI